MSVILSGIALTGWLGVVLWPALVWSTRERLHAARPGDTHCLSADEGGEIDVIVPARNEHVSLLRSLPAILAEPGVRVIVVDDESEDATASVAAEHGDRLEVVHGKPRPSGWVGKTWALRQGLDHVRRPYVLLLDADIVMAPGLLCAMRRKLDAHNLAFVSLLARPELDSPIERLLLPAYVFFFKILYPFSYANRPDSKVAAAAGGCLLIRASCLTKSEVLDEIRAELIDDCALARVVKRKCGVTWTGLTNDAVSIRGSGGLAGIWSMGARHAYTQLKYSPLILSATTVTMVLLLVVPPSAVFALPDLPGLLGLGAWLLMAFCYAATIRFYGLAPMWSLSLPLAGVLYLAMTWDAAWRFHRRGERANWRERVYTIKGDER